MTFILINTASPSISTAPSDAPSLNPTVSSMPSVHPTISPTDVPSSAPTGNLYYPDWLNENQVCVNDGADPSFMKEVQRLNYLYLSKEDCCQNHFWWRVQQCMGNDKPMYYSNGSHCDSKVSSNFDGSLFYQYPITSLFNNPSTLTPSLLCHCRLRYTLRTGRASIHQELGARLTSLKHWKSVATSSSGMALKSAWQQVRKR